MIEQLIKHRLVFPLQTTEKGKSATITRQLDLALMKSGFKLSPALFDYLAGCPGAYALEYAGTILRGINQLIGGHVQHNVYFKEFPKNVPDTEEFWCKCIIEWFFTGDSEYGRYQHSYEDMLKCHKKLNLKHPKFRFLHLGQNLAAEQEAWFNSLAQSVVPLNEDSRALLAQLAKREYLEKLTSVPVRENRAVLNALMLQAYSLDNLLLDTPLDVLRLACVLSGGDETLTKPTKFKSFSRKIRRSIVVALDKILVGNPAKIEDISAYKEQFKRLAERIHPREFSKAEAALELFDYAYGAKRVTRAHKVFVALQNKHFAEAINLLEAQPGRLVRSLDKIVRECTDAEFLLLKATLARCVNKVAGRVLLSVEEHLHNRVNRFAATRIFVNKAGKGCSVPNLLPPIKKERANAISKLFLIEVERRLPVIEHLVVDKGLERIALPLSEKTKSSGFAVLPRGSTFELDPAKKYLRFFTYWKQRSERTDFDLSCLFLSKDFEVIQQLSWTNLNNSDYGTHSGDLTEASKGATEMIEVFLDKIPDEVSFIVPSVNNFAGETFDQVEESFFGFMERSAAEKGAPFEAATVKTRFEMRGPNKVFMPIAFARGEKGWTAKWMDVNIGGLQYGNRVERNSASQSDMLRAVYEKDYLGISLLTAMLQKKAKKISKLSAKTLKDPTVTYIGVEKPADLVSERTFTLRNLRELIPA